MIDQQQVAGRDAVTAELAGRLWRAEHDRVAIDPISELWPDLTVDDAYAIQTRNVQRRRAAGRVIRGRKVGLTSRPMQEFLRVFEPTFGVLLDDMFVEDGDEIPLADLIQPRVEAEIAFVTKAPLHGPGCHIGDVLAATDFVIPAVEVIDSRYRDFKFDLKSVVADNCSSARYVTGGQPRRVDEVDLRTLGIVIEKNGVVISTAAGAAVLGHPAASVAMLANMLAERGEHIPAGTFVMTGGATEAYAVAPGDNIVVRYQDLGTVSLHFV